MEISSDFAGTSQKPDQATVQWRDTMNDAATIQDNNPGKLKEVYGRFTGMVLPGSEITVKVHSGKDGDPAGNFYSDVINQEGRKAISHGWAMLDHK